MLKDGTGEMEEKVDWDQEDFRDQKVVRDLDSMRNTVFRLFSFLFFFVSAKE